MTQLQFTDDLSVADDGWMLVERGRDADRAVAVGSNFMTGNGNVGYRATPVDAGPDEFAALVVADTYDCADGRWRELTTAPNPFLVTVSVAGEQLTSATAHDVVTSLDLRAARTLVRTVHPVGDRVVIVEAERFASLDRLDLLAQRVRVSADGPVEVTVVAGIDTDIWSLNGVHLPDIRVERDGDVAVAHGDTVESATTVSVAAHVGGSVQGEWSEAASYRTTAELGGESALVIDTIASVATSNGVADPVPWSVSRATEAAGVGYDRLLIQQRARWDEFWADHDICVEGAPLDDAAIRFSVYHNRICTPAHADHLPIGARGLSCQAYQGAAFWDQEIYNLPAFLMTQPEIARSILVYRHRTLDGARRKAARLGYDGAYYAWISGTTGDELCPDVFFRDVITGREIRNHFNVWQMHVAPDVVTTVRRYVDVTGDEEFLVDHGAEIAFEVARFLRSFVRWNDWRETYHCIRLLGPDEWHENVDDNAFTNHQTHDALSFAIDVHERLAASHPERLAALRDRLGLTDDELARWRHVRDHLLLPAPDADSGLIEQFDGFFELEDIAPDALRERLIDPSEYWGWPNGIAVRTQVSKQADVPMLLWLHADRFDDAVAVANYDYYEPRCSHNSSLSHAAFGMVAARIGRPDRALEHLRATALVDLLNTNHAVVAGTFIGGIHTAACGGTVQLAVEGLGGLGWRTDEQRLRLAPTLPAEWRAIGFTARWRGRRVAVRAAHDGVAVTADAGNDGSIELLVGDTAVVLAPGQRTEIAAPA